MIRTFYIFEVFIITNSCFCEIVLNCILCLHSTNMHVLIYLVENFWLACLYYALIYFKTIIRKIFLNNVRAGGNFWQYIYNFFFILYSNFKHGIYSLDSIRNEIQIENFILMRQISYDIWVS